MNRICSMFRTGAALALAVGVAFGVSLVAQESSTPPPPGSAGGEPRLTAAEVAAAQDGGELTVELAARALRQGDAAAETAAAIVRHEWTELPAALFDAIADEPRACACLLEEFAVAPRPAARNWAQRQAERSKLPRDVRCLALAAAEIRPTGKYADLLVEAAATNDDEEFGNGYRTAAWLLAPRDADRLIGRLHAALLERDAEFARFVPFFDRMSPRGYEHLVGLVLSLPPETKGPLVHYYVQNEVPAFQRRAADALDGKVDLEPIWLAQAEKLLTERSRVDRLLGVLRDDAASAELQQAAFRVLLAAGVVEPAMIAWADLSENRLAHVREILTAAVGTIAVDQIIEWLHDDVRIAQVTARALLRRDPLEPAIERELIALLDGVVATTETEPFVMAVLQRGSAEAVAALWPGLRRSQRFPQYVDAIARRRAPFCHALLLAELDQKLEAEQLRVEIGEERRAEQLDAVRIGLVSLGDRRQLQQLVERARTSRPAFVRRCTHWADPVGKANSLRLLSDAATVDDDLAVELITWAATTQDPAVEAELEKIWLKPELTERNIAALSGLGRGAARGRLITALRAAVAAGPLDDRHEALCYELVSTMSTPLVRADYELLAELVLLLPLGDPERDRRRAARWPDGRFGFPLAAAIAHRLRGGDPELAQLVFARFAAQAQEHPEFGAFAPQRLVVLWRTLVPDPAMQAAIGRATAAMLLAATNPEGTGRGAASYYAMQATEAVGKFDEAIGHARRAITSLLRYPVSRRAARIHLGEREPALGQDPWSALAARPFVLQARAALAAGETAAGVRAAGMTAAVRRALADARKLAGRDRATLATITELENR
ncbi:MAG: hypothetical protein NXI31_11545 [bacterium]|nr:hypothetical protein [bacterium]